MTHKWRVTSSSLPWISIIGKNIELVLFDFVFYKESTLLLIKCNNSETNDDLLQAMVTKMQSF